MKDKVSYNGNISSIDLLQLMFIALKLMGYIDWAWFWVLSPTWIVLTLVLIVALICK